MNAINFQPVYNNSIYRKNRKKERQELHTAAVWKFSQNSKAFRTPGCRKVSRNPVPLRGKRHAEDALVHSHISKQSLINIPGIDKIINSPNQLSRLMWICVVPVFYGLCVYQLVDRFTVYFNHPVGLEIKMLKNTSVQFPSVAVCPPYGPYITYITNLNNLDKIKRFNFNITFAELNTSMAAIWNESRISDEDIRISSSCLDKNGEPCDQLKVDTYELKTFWGTCIVKRIRFPLHYRGPQTSISLTVNREEKILTPDILKRAPWFQPIAKQIMFIPHDRRISPLHEVVNLGYKVSKGTVVEVRFSIREFHFIKTVENPCMSQAAEIACRSSCIEKDLEQYLGCWLPFMKENSSSIPCKTVDESLDAHFLVESLYSSNDGCNCPRQCDETVLTLLTDYHSADEPNDTVFILSYPDNSIEVVTENYSYTLNSLISDVGGSLGFIVGLCLFSFIEVIDFILQSFFVCFYTKRGHALKKRGHVLHNKKY